MAGRRPIPNELLFSFEPDDALFQALRDLGIPKTKAVKLLEAYGRPEALSQASERALRQTGGLTAPQAKRVHAAFRVAALCDETCERRVREGTKILDPAQGADFLRHAIGRKEQEWFAVILLSARQQVMDVLGLAVGSLSQVDIHPRELFREAIRRGAHSIIIAHNHPSGDAAPSDADIALTRRMAQVARMVGIPLLDHLVVTPTDSASLAALGMLPTGNPPKKKKRGKPKSASKSATFRRMMRI